MAGNADSVYQIKVSLNGAKPPIWRRLLVSSATDLAELHYIIQVAMGWADEHLHQFIAGGQFYGAPMPEFDDEMLDESAVRIGALLKKEKQSIAYEYDFGDDWEHKITLEKKLAPDSVDSIPKCTGGRRACPPEDVGGVFGYMTFLQKYSDEAHPDHEEMLEWVGDDFDPARFDPAEVNEVLKSSIGDR